MSLWDMFQGFGESLEDWGGGANDFGLGSINPAAGFMDSFKGLDMVGFPGPINPMGAFRNMDRSIPNLSEGFYQGFLNANNQDYGAAFEQAAEQRWMKDPNNIPLRNAEHGLFSNYMWDEHFPWGKMSPMVIPAYTGLKGLVQRYPALNPAVKFGYEHFGGPGSYQPYDLTKATPASWQEVWWGLRPFWGQN